MTVFEIQDEVVKVDQFQLSEILDVSSKTLRTYLLDGMPCGRLNADGYHSFDLVLCLYWHKGRKFAKRRSIEKLDALTYVLIGYLSSLDQELPQFWLPVTRRMAERMGVHEKRLFVDALFTAIYLTGRDLIVTH